VTRGKSEATEGVVAATRMSATIESTAEEEEEQSWTTTHTSSSIGRNTIMMLEPSIGRQSLDDISAKAQADITEWMSACSSSSTALEVSNGTSTAQSAGMSGQADQDQERAAAAEDEAAAGRTAAYELLKMGAVFGDRSNSCCVSLDEAYSSSTIIGFMSSSGPGESRNTSSAVAEAEQPSQQSVVGHSPLESPARVFIPFTPPNTPPITPQLCPKALSLAKGAMSPEGFKGMALLKHVRNGCQKQAIRSLVYFWYDSMLLAQSGHDEESWNFENWILSEDSE